MKRKDKSKARDKSTVDNLLLAGEMGKAPTPDFSRKSSGKETRSHHSPSPSISGVIPVGDPKPVEGAQESASSSLILQAMKEQNRQFSDFMAGMSSMMAGLVAAGPPVASQAHLPLSAVPSKALKKRKRSPTPEAEAQEVDDFATDEDEEGEVDSHHEEEEEAGQDLLDHFSSGSPAFVPGDRQLEMWRNALQLDPEFGKEAWTKVKAKGIVGKWVKNPKASPFTAPEPDSCLPDLKFSDHKVFERDFKRLMDYVGTTATIATRLLCLIEGKLPDYAFGLLNF